MSLPTIGDVVRERRVHLGLTQEELAEASRVSVETIRKLEQNVNTTARIATLNKLGRALGVPTSTLLGNATKSAARREPGFDGRARGPRRRARTPARGRGG